MDRKTLLGARNVIAQLQGWSETGNRDAIHKRFEFPDFRTAFAFMSKVADFADAHDHHPEWSNVYNRVDVELTTHDAGGVTGLDLQLGHFMDAAAAQLKAA